MIAFKVRNLWVLCFFAVGTLLSLAAGDIQEGVLLTNGRLVTGKILRQDERELVIETADTKQKLRFAKSQIASVLEPASAMFIVGNEHSARGRYRLAAAAYRRQIKQFPDNEWADDSWCKLGLAYQAEHEDRRALEAFSSLVEKFPSSDLAGQAQSAIGDSHRALGEFEEAVKAYDAAARSQPAQEEGLRLRIGETLLEAGKHKESIEVLQALIEKFPEGKFRDRAQALIWKNHFLIDKNSPLGKRYLDHVRTVGEGAKEAFRKAQKDYYRIYTEPIKPGRLTPGCKEVVDALQAVANEYPDSGWSLRAMYLEASVYSRCRMGSEAARLYETIADRVKYMPSEELAGTGVPELPRLRLEAAALYAERGRAVYEATRCLRKIIEEMPSDSHYVLQAYEQLADIYRRTNRYGEAAEVYREMKKKGYWQGPADPDLALLIRMMESQAAAAKEVASADVAQDDKQDRAWLEKFKGDDVLPEEGTEPEL